MRTLLAVLVLLALVPVASAHGDEADLGHLTLNVQDLAPGEFHSYNLIAEEMAGEGGAGGMSDTDLKAGWIFTLYGGVQGSGKVNVDLMHGNETEDAWVWTAGAFASNSTRLSFTGQHELVLTNRGNETVRYAFYFDQSCNCAYKVIPVNGGFVLFNYDLPKGRDVKLGFPTLDGWQLRGRIATLADPDGHWPEDFTVLETQEQKNKGWLQFDFRTEEAGVYYAFIEGLGGVGTNPDGSPDPIELTPLLEVSQPSSPGVGVLVALGCLAALAVWRRRA